VISQKYVHVESFYYDLEKYTDWINRFLNQHNIAKYYIFHRRETLGSTMVCGFSSGSLNTGTAKRKKESRKRFETKLRVKMSLC
jgi:hypothetical protein